ncbi:XRE family transcriptional regulator [Pseudoflavonifractor sp. 60]|uniref:helix-turn-helix domain-containing protein n=1 Tax=Pseudoflavonifractor sp. 60 TaxID=2304576 RepID=UPI00136A8273|nr:XRE family transcriptional regulator [Pseudoflavonifractor sp. 60]
MSEKIKQDISIGANLKRLRKNAKLSQQNVSIKLDLMGLDISRSIISQMEIGKYSIRVSVLRALKEIYKVDSYDEFFKDL